MDLAMEFGVPADDLARRMTEREFHQWARRNARRWLPARRMEWYLAQIAHLIAVTMGGAKDTAVSDFMLELESPTAEPAGADPDEARQFFGFKPRHKKA